MLSHYCDNKAICLPDTVPRTVRLFHECQVTSLHRIKLNNYFENDRQKIDGCIEGHASDTSHYSSEAKVSESLSISLWLFSFFENWLYENEQ